MLPVEPSDLPGSVQVGGGRAELLADVDRPGGYLLLIDRIRQSYVDLDDPDYLDFEYMQILADVLATLPEGRLSVTHIGGGALAFPRYVGAQRPGSPQIVFEPDAALTELVRARLPIDRHTRIRVRPEDGRSGLAGLRDGSADVVVLDAFAGGRVPGELTTSEALGEVARALAPGGVFLANLADGPPMTYLRRVVATARAALGPVVLIADVGVLRQRRYGNVVLASGRSLDLPQIEQRSARAPFPRRVLRGSDLSALVGSAPPLTDRDPMRSPPPPEESWRVGDY